MIDLKELAARLRKTIIKDKKGKALFFESVEKEILNNYPPEVYAAHKAGERYAILDPSRTKVIRIHNLDRKYGLSPLFKALRYVILLDEFAAADRDNAKAKAKKIIFQKLHKEVLGADFRNKGWEDQRHAHNEFVAAFKQKTVLYTAPPCIESIEIVDMMATMVDPKTINEYRLRIMTTLGIGFLINDAGTTVSTANISIDQLLLCVNKLGEQLESALESWYKLILEEQSIAAEYAPSLTVLDSEMLSAELKEKLAKTLHTTFSASRETTFGLLGFNLDDETEKRKKENEEDLDSVYMPYPTSFNTGGDDKKNGRPPADNDPSGKQDYDKNRNDNMVT